MLPRAFSIKDDFPSADYDQWRSLVEEELQGASFEQRLVTHTYEGIDIQPVYTSTDQVSEHDMGVPGSPPFIRGATAAAAHGWDLRQQHSSPDIATCNRDIHDDLLGGATSLVLTLDASARAGRDPDDSEVAALPGSEGITVSSVDDLDRLLDNVDISVVGLAFEAGAAYGPVAAMLAALFDRRRIATEKAFGALNADPLGVLAREGRLPMSADESLSQLADVAIWAAATFPVVKAVAVDTDVYHHAGATAAQDIAFAMATGVQYLRALTDAGMEIDAAARSMVFRLSLGTHHFLAIAKLRAARRLWCRIIQASGGSDEASAMYIHARTSERVLTQRDPYVNLLRNTVGVFAACVGGADAISSIPFDVAAGMPDRFSRRIARNTLLILQEESHLHRVLDPAGGSWFLDRITEQLADVAWDIFQDVERQGGMLAALQVGWIASQIDSAYAPRAKDIARRKEGITGVSEFPNVAEEPIRHPRPDTNAVRQLASERIERSRIARWDGQDYTNLPNRMSRLVEAAAAGATIGQLSRAMGMHRGPIASVPPLEARSFAEPFEELRDASDTWQSLYGKRPTVFLANMGPVSHHLARATFSKNFFEAGGFDVVSSDSCPDASAAAAALVASGAKIAVICSSDKLYPEIVPPTTAALKGAGARSVILAGNPGANESTWRAAGVDRFIFIKCDVLATLREILRDEGVLKS